LETAGKYESALTKRSLQAGDELTAKHAAQDAYRQEKRVARANPAPVVERQPAGWDHTMDVRVMQKILAPGMKHTQEADLRAEMFRISSHLQQSRGAGAEQEIVNDLLII
jgi:hypothetical protein